MARATVEDTKAHYLGRYLLWYQCPKSISTNPTALESAMTTMAIANSRPLIPGAAQSPRLERRAAATATAAVVVYSF